LEFLENIAEAITFVIDVKKRPTALPCSSDSRTKAGWYLY